MAKKNPFVVVDELISPLMCEDYITRLKNTFPNYDAEGNPEKTYRANALSEIRTLPAIEELMPELEAYYGFTLRGILPFNFEWYVPGVTEPPRCENSLFRNNMWRIKNDIDFTGIIFLNDHREKAPFDPRFECRGGKLEFPGHQFGFLPSRGTFIFFPSGPNFINYTAPIQVGELNQIRIQFVAEERYKYNRADFQGNYIEWFKSTLDKQAK